MKPICIYPHLGLGDAIICNGLVRTLAEQAPRIYFLAKHNNAPTVAAMFEDDPRIFTLCVRDDEEAASECKRRDGECRIIPLGCHAGGPTYSDEGYDRHFYRHAGVPFDNRWTKFKVPAIPYPKPSGALIHSDDRFRVAEYWQQIALQHVGTLTQIVPRSPSLLDWLPEIMGAEEIHCIPSSVFLLVDSLPDMGETDLFLHRYSRGNITYPTMGKEWLFIDVP